MINIALEGLHDYLHQYNTMKKHIIAFIKGFVVGILPLLVFVLSFFMIFNVILASGNKRLAISLYSCIPLIFVLKWVANLILGIYCWQTASKFSLGIFTSLGLLLFISPGLFLAWALAIDGFGGH